MMLKRAPSSVFIKQNIMQGHLYRGVTKHPKVLI